ncbi:hypothetical protein FRC18_002225 [Serendipita sp. 400]|nr:hypothetical protein FRC18_002225 [Serendipita sp. 400]
MTIWDSGTNLDPNVNHTLTCVKTSADGGDRDLYIDAFVLTLPNSTTVPVLGAASTDTTSATQTTYIVSSRPSMTNGPITADHSTISNIALDPPIGSDDSMSPTAGIASTSETASIIAKDTGMSNAAKIGIALGALVFICLCSAIFFLLSRRKRASDSLKHLSSYHPDDTNSAGFQGSECGKAERGMPSASGILQWRRGVNADAVHDLDCASGTSAFTGSILETSLDVRGPPPYSPRSASSSS